MRINIILRSLVLAVALFCIPAGSRAVPRVGFVVSVRIAPPILPVYVQAICPGPGYIWGPGYWAYGDEGFYWVPGTWVLPPSAGLLWTPGYWGFSEGLYVWHVGYWGPSVGFYGGVNYGFGYPGRGFYGGHWRGAQYFYNTEVTNVNRTIIHNVYRTTVINERSPNRVSFNGGAHGIQARPTSAELTAAHERHIAMTSVQIQHQRGARANRTLLASVNHGRPDVAATARPATLSNHRESPNNRATHSERPVAKNPRESSQPERSSPHKTVPASRPTPARSERPGEHRAAPVNSARPTPSRTGNTPAHHPVVSTPKPAAPRTEKPAVHQQTAKPAPRTSHQQIPNNSHSASHPSQQRAAAPRASAPHPTRNEQSHANNNKPQHQDHQ
jgi:WXXGXW repeat (2 copies)